MPRSATYVYCLVAHARRPSLARVPAGLPGTGRVRLVDVSAPHRAGRELHRSLVVADAPLSRFGEAAIAKGLSNLDWVSRAAVAHERVTEAFIGAAAVLPMKLFTIFSDDERAVESIRRDEPRISRLLKRVAGHDEWGVRVTLAPVAQPAGRPATRRSGAGTGGAGYLAQKKARRDAAAELVLRSRETAANVFDEAARLASDARRRSVAEPGGDRGPLLLDAVFLVPARAAARFQKTIERRARALASAGYHVVLTGPWPPYGFIQD